jgi:methyltransferase-like protein
MAEQLPESKFIGIDFSAVQIRQAEAIAQELQLPNIEFIAGNIAEIDAGGLGSFDYIIAHGVYSWVPQDVRTAMLQLFRRCLAPNGIAFCSFNTYPGWHFRGMIRDMMRYHVRQFPQPDVQIRQARALLTFLAENAKQDTAYGKLLSQELERLSKQSDGYLFHEHLESHNEPLYFHHFAEDLGKSELQYLGDAEISTMWVGNFSEAVAETLERIAPDLIQQEQYADFLRNRMFRQSLVCHAGLVPDRAIRPEKLQGAFVAGDFRLADESKAPNLEPRVSERFIERTSGSVLETNVAITKGAIVELGRAFPRAMTMPELWERVLAITNLTAAQNPETAPLYQKQLGLDLVRMFASGRLELKFTPDCFTTEIRERPCVSPLVRLQARGSGPITNRRHDKISMDDTARRFAGMLDGNRTPAQIIDELTHDVISGRLVVEDASRDSDLEESRVRKVLRDSLQEALVGFARNALLI